MSFKFAARVISLSWLVAGLVACAGPTATTDPFGANTPKSLTYLDVVQRYRDLKSVSEHRISKGEVTTATLGYACIAYGKLKQYSKLFDCLEKLERSIQGGDTELKSDIKLHTSLSIAAPSDARPLPYLLRAEALLELGQYQTAVASGVKALDLVSDQNKLGATWPPARYKFTILPVLAIAAMQAGDKPRSEHFIRELQATRIEFGSESLKHVRSNGLARAYMALGEYEQALEHLDGPGVIDKLVFSILDSSSAISGDDSAATISEVSRLLMRAKALFATGQTEKARTLLDEILAAPRIQDVGDLYWLALFERGRIAEIEKAHAQAAELYRQAVEVVEQQRSSIGTEASKIGFVGDKQALYVRLVTVLIAQNKTAEAFDYVERSKSRALVDLLASKQDFAPQGDLHATKLMVAKLDAADLESRADVSLKSEEGGGGRRTLQVAHQTLRAVAPELSSLVSVNSVPLDELRALIRPDETLVEYYYQGTELYVFVLTRAGLRAVRLDAHGLVAQAQALRKSIENPQSNEWPEFSRALYARLWRPIEAQVATRNVIIVAHGVLHYLPFAALQYVDGSFLADRYSLRLLPSASVLKFLKPALPNKQAPVLVFGNPDLGDSKLDLLFAEGEAKAVVGLYPASKLFTRKEASETAFKRSATTYSRIHFATHGKFQADAPLTSGLYLASDATNDGLLTVGELYAMNLNADLVTLSACETGLGKIVNGDDVVGLTRGFLYAGSRSIVASLWSVDDKATAEFMKAFYQNLEKLPKHEALRQAQIRTRQSYPHPFYWAAFQLTGRSD